MSTQTLYISNFKLYEHPLLFPALALQPEKFCTSVLFIYLLYPSIFPISNKWNIQLNYLQKLKHWVICG